MNTPDLLTRQLSAEILDAVLNSGKELEEEYSRCINKERLEGRDKTFVRLLVTVTLRRLGQIDDIISRFLKKPLPEKVAYVQNILRLSTAQMVFLDTPPHAAVSTGVSLIKSSKKYNGFSKLINAVLRRIAEKGKEIAERQDAAKLNIPAWLFEKWSNEYGEEKARKIALAGFQKAPLDFSVKSDPESWAKRLEAVIMPTGSLRREKQAVIPLLDGYEEGNWWVQDLSAAMPARLFHSPNGKRAVDICAAPGGKTAQLISAGASVTAVDISENRICRLKENLERLNFHAETVCADVMQWWKDQNGKIQKFDLVLLDAPCSATGTLRRHPDVLLHRMPQDILRLHDTQKELLRTAVRMMSDNAEMIYCVCSVLPDEGRLVVNEAVQEGLVERVPLTAAEVPEEMISRDGDLLILPFLYESIGGCDGFFAARLKKTGD